ncbi:hypothetical protein A4X13_0g7322 [Tilletia indica]|uniref:Flavin reductase like domain-containing protein n=1 Tax=Tilletia indica TaxID=43049 RepID=A0A177T8A5_9BASI|nr:hypothetical protein A4X13_0g7322 [Tilletia indica]
MPNHPDIAEVQASRAPFNSEAGFNRTRPPQTEWKAGQGLNDMPQSKSLFAGDQPMRVINPAAEDVPAGDIYKFMCGGIAPRPVALVSTLNEEGVPNLAPISWYQMVSHDPPLVMISFGGPGTNRKDSEKNIKARKQFTISSSSEPYVEALNYASIDTPRGVSEFTISGLTPEPSLVVDPPRVKEAPFAMECQLEFVKDWENDKGVHTTSMVIGRVLRLHIREDCIDPSNGSLDPAKTMPVSRFGGLLYSRSTEGYELVRPKFEDVKETEEIKTRLEDAKVPFTS